MGRERGRSLDTVAAGAAGQQRYIPDARTVLLSHLVAHASKQIGALTS
jgi:hypothetical protein